MKRNLFTVDHDAFRAGVRSYIQLNVAPYHQQWEADGIVSRVAWEHAGAHGLLCMDVPETYGGVGQSDFRYTTILIEEFARANCSGPGFNIHSNIVVPYILHYANEEQKQRWLPDLVSGKKIAAIAMTEPNAGSDLNNIQSHAVDMGEHYTLNGSKTFITNGIHADIVIVVCKTAPEKKMWGMSLLVVERGMEGFTRGRKIEKVGWRAQDTAELFFDDVCIPKENLLGKDGQGFFFLQSKLARERLVIAIGSLASADAAIDWTMDFYKSQETFSQDKQDAQHLRFKIAEMKSEVAIGQAFVDRCIQQENEGKLNATDAAIAKWWVTDLHKRVIDQCVQLQGDFGYLSSNPIAQAWLDMRWRPIGGGTNEIMKDLIGHNLGF